jgi:hypothetical protein
MAKKCYYITYTDCAGRGGTDYVCAEDLEYRSGGGCGGGYFFSVSNGFNSGNASEQAGTVVQVDCSNCSNCCTSVAPDKPCDCLNGGCIPATLYGTPGKYATLALCQAGCAKDSNCVGECVSVEEIAALQAAANNLQSKFCK